jgi:hypothetical protein
VDDSRIQEKSNCKDICSARSYKLKNCSDFVTIVILIFLLLNKTQILGAPLFFNSLFSGRPKKFLNSNFTIFFMTHISTTDWAGSSCVQSRNLSYIFLLSSERLCIRTFRMLRSTFKWLQSAQTRLLHTGLGVVDPVKIALNTLKPNYGAHKEVSFVKMCSDFVELNAHRFCWRAWWLIDDHSGNSSGTRSSRQGKDKW